MLRGLLAGPVAPLARIPVPEPAGVLTRRAAAEQRGSPGRGTALLFPGLATGILECMTSCAKQRGAQPSLFRVHEASALRSGAPGQGCEGGARASTFSEGTLAATVGVPSALKVATEGQGERASSLRPPSRLPGAGTSPPPSAGEPHRDPKGEGPPFPCACLQLATSQCRGHGPGLLPAPA